MQTEKRQILIEETRKEIKDHGVYAFPVDISIEHIEAYDQGKFLWHWHPEIELTLILSGQMEYRINDRIYIVRQGDGLFGNSNTLHAGAQIDGSDCTYLSITFHPRFIYGYEGSVLQQKYVDVITGNSGLGSLHLSKNVDWQNKVMEKMYRIYELSGQEKVSAYELLVHNLLMEIWYLFYTNFDTQPQDPHILSKQIHRLQEMIIFLQNHSREDISLEDVSAHMNLCKNECCRFFKKYMNMTIVEYLTMLRIQNSLPLLERGESVTRTANLVGFSSPAYFSQMFRRHMNQSPKEYQQAKA